MQSRTIPIEDFIELFKSKQYPLLDARSTSEYKRGHIPGAMSLPLMDDEARKIIGTIYKQQGREAAVLKGFELIGPEFHQKIIRASELAPEKNVMVYCWRGGMRSNILAWILQMAGFKVVLLKGGYKTFRHWVIETYSQRRNLIVLGGQTGSGKTEMLHLLQEAGEQIVDLEGIAHHKGSAFGALGQAEQYTQEQFENYLGWNLSYTNQQEPLWIENESRHIGKNQIPNALFDQIRTSAKLVVNVDRQVRADRIMNEYGFFDKDILIEKTMDVSRRMGPQHAKEAIEHLTVGEVRSWVEKMLTYYDKTYDHSGSTQSNKKIVSVDFNWDNKDVSIRNMINKKSEL
ncbi:MAG: tRNA 2-selenouridine(34) synthase MnmH [Bacteroidota bacterium]